MIKHYHNKCGSCKKNLPGFYSIEDQSKNGVRVLVTRTKDGSTVNATCSCFGNIGRVHNTTECPLYKKYNKQK